MSFSSNSRMRKSSFLAISAFLFPLLTPTNAQLVGCKVINCPKSNGFDSCAIGNATLTSIGSIAFNTTITPQPLTWTVGFETKQELKSTTSSGGTGKNGGSDCNSNANFASQECSTFTPTSFLTVGEVDYRHYYLGTPPGFDFSTTAGCTLFFEGVANNITFPGPTPRTDVGTCNDALTASCVSDLIAQAKMSIIEMASNPPPAENGTCVTLANTLQNNAPVSCKDAKGQSWGNVTTKAFGDPSILLNMPPAPCSPTTGNNYNLSLIQTTKGEETAITPILTVLMSAANGTSTVEPDISLECLKPVGGPLPEVASPSAVAGKVTSGSLRVGMDIGSLGLIGGLWAFWGVGWVGVI